MVIIFINDLQNRKLCKVIERYLAKIRFFTAKSQSVSGASHQPAYIGSFRTICQTCRSCSPSGRVSLRSMPPYDWANGGSLYIFGGMVSMVLVSWELMLFYRMRSYPLP